jgi:hypothetical protein
MNEGMFNHIMEALDAIHKRMDRMIALMEEQRNPLARFNNPPARDTSTPPDEAIVQVDEVTAAKMESDFEPVRQLDIDIRTGKPLPTRTKGEK